jgi:hypothetical protein
MEAECREAFIREQRREWLGAAGVGRRPKSYWWSGVVAAAR